MSRSASVGPVAKAAGLTVLSCMMLSISLIVASSVMLLGLRQPIGDDIPTVEVITWLWAWSDEPHIRKWAGIGLFAGLLPLVGVAALAIAAMKPKLHGDAKWALEAEIRREGLRARDGILLARKTPGFMSLAGSEHVIAYAPTRSGKGVGVVIPNLLNWAGSVVVLDIKNENWAATAGFRRNAGQEVHLFNPLDPEGRTARYNPLAYIQREDPTDRIVELQKIANLLVAMPERADPFFATAARAAFVAIGLLVAESPKRPFTLGEIYRQLTEGDLVTRLPKMVKERAKAGNPFTADTVRALNDLTNTAAGTFASIRQTLSASLSLWINPRVDAATSASDFDLRDLRHKGLSIYLGTTPDNLAVIQPLYNLFFQQLIDLNVRTLPRPGLDRHQVLVLLDEFAQLGRADMLARAFAFAAGYGLRLLPVIQSPAQLRAIYGADVAKEIMTNCAVEIVYTPKELDDANALSERLGTFTYKSTSRSSPRGLGKGRYTQSESDQRRPLMLPQELMRFPKNRLILLRAGIGPIRARKIVYYSDKAFLRRVLPPPVPDPIRPQHDGGNPAPATPAEEVAARAMMDREIDEPQAAALEDLASNFEDAPAPPTGDGVTPHQMAAWIGAYIDAKSKGPEREVSHVRRP